MEINKTKAHSNVALETANLSQAKQLQANQNKINQNDIQESGANHYNVQVSSEAKEMEAAHRKAFDIAKGTPDVCQDRVADLKSQIKNGTYKPDSGKIADGMLREAIKDQMATTL
jgi:negative regulator of flagellin synthesis FlgM